MLGMIILTNGDRLIGEIYDGYVDDQTSNSYQIENPYKMEFRTIDGDYAFLMTPYVHFMDSSQTHLDIQKSQIISIVVINDELQKYYLNTKIFNAMNIKPVLERGLVAVNEALELAINPTNVLFSKALKKHKIDDFPSNLLH